MNEQVAGILASARGTPSAVIAGIADLSARLAVERRLVENTALVSPWPSCDLSPSRTSAATTPSGRSRSQPRNSVAPTFAQRNHTVSVAASPEPAHDARYFALALHRRIERWVDRCRAAERPVRSRGTERIARVGHALRLFHA
jgi:hypothetical protein